jgi:hypothetical protein
MSSARSWAPWSAEEVANLAAWQACGWVHPYTCPESRPLTPGPDGWVCTTCGYEQLWCWAPMLNGPPPDPVAALRGEV